jgi:hypothetical protein
MLWTHILINKINICCKNNSKVISYKTKVKTESTFIFNILVNEWNQNTLRTWSL